MRIQGRLYVARADRPGTAMVETRRAGRCESPKVISRAISGWPIAIGLKEVVSCSLVPIFPVPLLHIFHVISLAQVLSREPRWRRACRFRPCPTIIARNHRRPGTGPAETVAGHNWKGDIMRFMILVKATKQSEAGILPDQKLLAEMGKFNEELARAGILLAGEGLQPSSKGARVRFSGDKRTVIDGPFAETKELIAGFWLWQVKSMEEAVEWLKRCPNPTGIDGEVEIRPVFEAEDFGPELTPELREQEERLRAQLEGRK